MHIPSVAYVSLFAALICLGGAIFQFWAIAKYNYPNWAFYLFAFFLVFDLLGFALNLFLFLNHVHFGR